MNRVISTSRSIARRVLPMRLRHLLWYAGSADFRRRRREVRETLRATGQRIVAGPFEGLTFEGVGNVAALLPKLLGTFECELFPAIEDICVSARHDTLIDIGAAEGYYSAGFARRIPALRVISFETLPSERQKLATFLARNEVASRAEIFGKCTGDGLAAQLQKSGRTLIKCDIEGAEHEVLDPARVPALGNAEILVEVHDHLTPDTSNLIRRRFASTHNIDVFQTQARDQSYWPSTIQYPSDDAVRYLDEGRAGPMIWFWMKPKAS